MMRVSHLSVMLMLAAGGPAQPARQTSVDDLLGTWRGTSTCVDRVAAPACQDEVIVYEFRRADKAEHVIVKADKIVNDGREPMGELEFAYDGQESCWRADFESPRVKSRWCLTTAGPRMKGTARLLPGNEVVRRVQLTRVSR